MTLRSAAAHRNLLYLLSMKELRTRYKKSILGWAWSLLNPLTQMGIFTVIFIVIFKAVPQIGDPSGLKNFPLYFLAGMLPFNFFSISVGTSIGAVQGGAGLIKKVQFPHEHLVFSVIVAQFVTLLIELLVLTVAMLLVGNDVLPWLPVLLLLLVLLAVFTSGVALALAAANVFYHDVNYLWGILSQILFYATPVIWNPATRRKPVAVEDRQLQPDGQLHHRRPQRDVRPAPAGHRPVDVPDRVRLRYVRGRRVDLQQALAQLRRGNVTHG